MSHVVDCNIVIKDLEAFKAACEELGMEFRLNQKTWKWYGQWVNDYDAQDAAYKAGIKPEDYGKCVHAAAVKGDSSAYELGLVKNPKGEGFLLVFDFFGTEGRALQEKIGKNASKLKSEYGLKLLEKTAKKRGYKVEGVTRSKVGQVTAVNMVKKH